jgi:hypothetical protein
MAQSNLDIFNFDVEVDLSKKKCIFCGEQNPDFLQKHHVIPRRLHDKLPSKFHSELDVNETVVICHKCHKRYHLLVSKIINLIEEIIKIQENEELYTHDKIALFFASSWNGEYIGTLYQVYSMWCESLNFNSDFGELYRFFDFFRKKGYVNLVRDGKKGDSKIIIKDDLYPVLRRSLSNL